MLFLLAIIEEVKNGEEGEDSQKGDTCPESASEVLNRNREGLYLHFWLTLFILLKASLALLEPMCVSFLRNCLYRISFAHVVVQKNWMAFLQKISPNVKTCHNLN